MNAIELLQRDHEQILAVLRDVLRVRSGAERGELFDVAEELLQVHSGIEEDIFYPAVYRAAGTAWALETYIKSRDEHKLVDAVLPQLRFTDTRSEAFRAKVRLTRELVAHHIETENQDLLPLASEVLSRDRLEDLGERMQRHDASLRGKVILATQARSFDCDRDGFRIATPFCTIVSGLGC
jgi:hemerythrin-like domain-containing protein